MDIADFLLARIGEREALANAVADSVLLAECEAKRRIMEKLVATQHEVVEDCWYTCAAATEDHDGGECCDDSRREKGCDCGRDARVDGYLRLLALPYAEHPDYDPEWKV